MNLNPLRRRMRTRTVEICCNYCGQWRKPRHIRMPTAICLDCEAVGANQTWHPTTLPAVAPARQLVTGGHR